MFDQYESEGCKLNFTSEFMDSLSFLSDANELPKLVFFHTELNCNSCVEQNTAIILIKKCHNQP
jgi:hypothetical protein